jgi:hypothetical protein
LRLVALASFMLLSVTKAAHAAVSGDAWQEIRVLHLILGELCALALTPGFFVLPSAPPAPASRGACRVGAGPHLEFFIRPQ